MKANVFQDSEYEKRRDFASEIYFFMAKNNHCMPHFHSSIELVYVYSGCLNAIMDGENYNVHAGEVLISSSYTVHSYRVKEPSEEMVLVIPLHCVPALQKQLQSSVFGATVYSTEKDDSMRSILSVMLNHWEELSVDSRQGLCYTLLSMLITGAGLKPRSGDSKSLGVIKEALIYLQENYQSSLQMEDLARRFGYSKSRFSHLFNETLGIPPSSFVNSLRCRHAARAMMESDQTLLEISFNSGFECPRTFYRAFREYYGMTPTQYIKSQKNARQSP